MMLVESYDSLMDMSHTYQSRMLTCLMLASMVLSCPWPYPTNYSCTPNRHFPSFNRYMLHMQCMHRSTSQHAY